MHLLNGPRREKTCLWGFCQSEIQISLLSYRDNLENWNFTSSMFTYEISHKANIKGADAQTDQRLCCTQTPRRQVFSRRGRNNINSLLSDCSHSEYFDEMRPNMTHQQDVFSKIILNGLPEIHMYMCLIPRKPVFGVSDRVRFKQAWRATKTS